MKRWRIEIEGRVQGVGFRPTVYRLAVAHALSGFVHNTPHGVLIEVQGAEPALTAFAEQLRRTPPPHARIAAFAQHEIPTLEDSRSRPSGIGSTLYIRLVEPVLYRLRTLFYPRHPAPRRGGQTGTSVATAGFTIAPSQRSGDLLAGMPPDLATCAECRHELFDPGDRRHRYPFLNCTHCGPRFTIIRALPYDRDRTAMASFALCPACRAEFDDPRDRRFDAQPNACPWCGPVLRLVDAQGGDVAGDPLANAVLRLRAGGILAVKGIGGYHLCCDATSEAAIAALRTRKRRPAKALAVMCASLDQARTFVTLGEEEARALTSAAAPIVVLPRRADARPPLPAALSPDTDDLGIFLPYSPLHHLLLAEISPLVMTSGNRTDEPIACDEEELRPLLGPIADAALIHNRPIIRRCDDSVMIFSGGIDLSRYKTGSTSLVDKVKPIPSQRDRLCAGDGSLDGPLAEQSLPAATGRLWIRRSRGIVPDPIVLPLSGPSVLACGAELKNTVCVTRDRQAFLSQHIGDLEEYRALRFFGDLAADFMRLLRVEPALIAYDLHPDYLSTRYALASPIPRKIGVQHHHAHLAACLAEHGVTAPVLGVALDGTGYGPDGTIWGGEFLVADLRAYRRVARFKPVRMPGGVAAIRHPLRMALGYLADAFGAEAEAVGAACCAALPADERRALLTLVARGAHAPWTSSAGRLFDAVAALLGFDEPISYEGQAAIRLQTLAARAAPTAALPYALESSSAGLDVSFAPAIRALVEARRAGHAIPPLARAFHRTVADAVADVCARLRAPETGDRVALSGGVFQNTLLLEQTAHALRQRGFQLYIHHAVPPNDAGIALGQAVVALAQEAGPAAGRQDYNEPGLV